MIKAILAGAGEHPARTRLICESAEGTSLLSRAEVECAPTGLSARFSVFPPANPREAIGEKVHQHAIAYNRDEF